jgi:arabinose-5-phosphate isomerase
MSRPRQTPTALVEPAPVLRDAHLDGELTSTGREVLRMEADAVAALADRVDDSFPHACRLILECQARVVVTGMGKSGAIARKIAATLASTGTPALFLHPAEGVHGDLGMVTSGDVVLALSYSGESDEIVAILPVLKRMGIRLIAFTGSRHSTLALHSEVVLDVSVPREACPHNLAPTSSTTASLALGDALALAVMRARRFTPDDFAVFHPAGALGRRLLLRVGDLMRTGDGVARVAPETPLHDALFAMTRSLAGAALVTDRDGGFLGLLTDGDIRRLLLADERVLHRPIGEVMKPSDRTTIPARLVSEALAEMQKDPPISEMPVLDDTRRVVGYLHLKDIVKAGIV